MRLNQQHIFLFTWLLVLIAIVSTIYASEVMGLPICHLCWYQRICIFPLLIILGIGTFNNDSTCIRYSIPLAVCGAVFAIYQYLEQMFPGFSPVNVCGSGASCSQIHLKLFGFITLPLLSLIGCIVIITLLMIAKRRSTQ